MLGWGKLTRLTFNFENGLMITSYLLRYSILKTCEIEYELSLAFGDPAHNMF